MKALRVKENRGNSASNIGGYSCECMLPNVCCIASRMQALSPYQGRKSFEVRDCTLFIFEVRETGTGSVLFASLQCFSYGGHSILQDERCL